MGSAAYIKFDGVKSTDYGWYIQVGGRKDTPPKMREIVITDIPFRKNPLDISNADGNFYYDRRTVSYTFVKRFSTAVEAQGGADDFVSWLMSCRLKDMYDSVAKCTYKNAKCSDVSSSQSKLTATVTVNFTADPYKVKNGDEVL